MKKRHKLLQCERVWSGKSNARRPPRRGERACSGMLFENKHGVIVFHLLKLCIFVDAISNVSNKWF